MKENKITYIDGSVVHLPLTPEDLDKVYQNVSGISKVSIGYENIIDMNKIPHAPSSKEFLKEVNELVILSIPLSPAKMAAIDAFAEKFPLREIKSIILQHDKLDNKFLDLTSHLDDRTTIKGAYAKAWLEADYLGKDNVGLSYEKYDVVENIYVELMASESGLSVEEVEALIDTDQVSTHEGWRDIAALVDAHPIAVDWNELGTQFMKRNPEVQLHSSDLITYVKVDQYTLSEMESLRTYVTHTPGIELKTFTPYGHHQAALQISKEHPDAFAKASEMTNIKEKPTLQSEINKALKQKEAYKISSEAPEVKGNLEH